MVRFSPRPSLQSGRPSGPSGLCRTLTDHVFCLSTKNVSHMVVSTLILFHPVTMPKSRPFIASPVKQRDPKKTQTIVRLQRIETRRKHLQEKIFQLMNPPSIPTQSDSESTFNSDTIEVQAMNAGEEPIYSLLVPTSNVPEVPAVDYNDDSWPSQCEEYVEIETKRPRRIHPNDEARLLYVRWEGLLPSLEEPYLQFLTETTGRPSYTYPTVTILPSLCKQRCVPKIAKVLCLFQDCKCMLLILILFIDCTKPSKKKQLHSANAPLCRLFSFGMASFQPHRIVLASHYLYTCSTSIKLYLNVPVMQSMRSLRPFTLFTRGGDIVV